MSGARIIFSTAEPYYRAAVQELRAAFPRAVVDRLGPEVGWLEFDGVEIADVAHICRRRPIVFVRHLMREEKRIPLSAATEDVARIARVAWELMQNHAATRQIAVHAWTSGSIPAALRADHLWLRVAAELREQHVHVARANQEQVLSICVTPSGVVLGINRRADALADWPGGRVRLARSPDQISRSEFKLEELSKVFEPALPDAGIALDLGASPGGWTRIARRAGLTVWAVDPGDLDPPIAADPGVHHARTTAGPFLAATDIMVDLVLNDMRMTPERSCQVMLDAALRLKPDGLAIVTLKISPRDPVAIVSRALRTLAPAYEILFARQLYHNRHEVTVVARRRRERGSLRG